MFILLRSGTSFNFSSFQLPMRHAFSSPHNQPDLRLGFLPLSHKQHATRPGFPAPPKRSAVRPGFPSSRRPSRPPRLSPSSPFPSSPHHHSQLCSFLPPRVQEFPFFPADAFGRARRFAATLKGPPWDMDRPSSAPAIRCLELGKWAFSVTMCRPACLLGRRMGGEKRSVYSLRHGWCRSGTLGRRGWPREMRGTRGTGTPPRFAVSSSVRMWPVVKGKAAA